MDTDTVLLAEPDDGYFLSFYETSSREYLVLSSSQGEVSERYVVPTNDISKAPVLLAGRDKGFAYSVDHAHGKFYIRANDTHKNFRLAVADDTAPEYAKLADTDCR